MHESFKVFLNLILTNFAPILTFISLLSKNILQMPLGPGDEDVN